MKLKINDAFDQRKNIPFSIVCAGMMLAFFTWRINFQVGLIVLGSILLHEAGHVLGFKRRYVSSVVTVYPLWAVTRPREEDRLEYWCGEDYFVMLAAGVVVNIMLSLMGLLMMINPDWHGIGYPLFFVNIALAAINLVPISAFDGGKLVLVLIHSMDRRSAQVAGRICAAGSAVAFLATWQFLEVPVFYYIVLGAFGYMAASDRVKDDGGYPRLMKLSRRWLWAGGSAYVLIVATTLLIYTECTPLKK